MIITRQVVAEQLSAYLQGQQRLADVVSWAEEAMREGEFDEADFGSSARSWPDSGWRMSQPLA